ncbi:hypothetical protein [Succinivibrio dextrinosolvens]|uniref:hypothetical protein n=1 Tax=Succinivibrio dextrinosolvens TaxID=83771 RepID=UPI00241DD10A|nr:hypothetical protein [Succinivibrio dextrinosolvens]MBE6422587.1 hypothetical protein [Succinivibrio dextrinosolvens]
MNRIPKRGEIWTNGTAYCYIFMVAKDMGTDKKRVIFQILTNDEEMVIHCQGGEILSIKIRQPYSMDLQTFKEKMKLFKETPKK